MTCKNEFTKNALARLRYVLNEIYFIVIDGVDRTNSHKYWKNLSKIAKIIKEKKGNQ